jgi:hypothetical protein
VTAPGRDDTSLPSDRFVFLFVFDFNKVFELKNPIAVVEAFSQAFAPDEGPLLVIKSINGERSLTRLEQLRAAVFDRADIELRDGYISARDHRALMFSCDAYVSLHRGEGLGATIAEAMAYGRPVIATGYSGNPSFMSDENSFLVPYQLTPIPKGCEPYPAGAEWAEPDREAAAGLLRYVYEHQEEADVKGEQARQDVQERRSVDGAAEFLSARLDEIRAGRPVRESSPAAAAEAPATQKAAQYLVEGPSVPIDAPSRFGLLGVFARRLVYRLLRPYIVRQREFEIAVVRALAEVEEIAHREARAAEYSARVIENNGEEASRAEGAKHPSE